MNQVSNEIITFLQQISNDLNERLDTIETRLARLEKMDSIEHRVEVNQIDLSDIKELLQNLEENQHVKIANLIEELYQRLEKPMTQQINNVTKRLDSQLLKIAKTEEEMYLMKSQLDEQK